MRQHAVLLLTSGLLVLAGCSTATSPSSSIVPTAAPTSTPLPAKVVSSAAPPVTQTVTYSCTGHAADGVDITYGPEGSSLSASSLPFTKTAALDTNVQYFVTEAQLQGDGSVSCTTVIHYTDSSGNTQSVTQSATASGGYNIASAEVCSTFTGGWQDC
jgi:hypothetical protein